MRYHKSFRYCRSRFAGGVDHLQNEGGYPLLAASLIRPLIWSSLPPIVVLLFIHQGDRVLCGRLGMVVRRRAALFIR